MSADWRVAILTEDIRGQAISDVQIVVTVWTGGASIDRRTPVIVSARADVTVDAAAQSIVVELRHARYAPLTMALVRGPTESVWRWTDPNRVVRTTGSDVTVFATLSRIRAAPTVFVPEDQLARKADAALPALRAAVDKAKRARRKTVPQFVVADGDLRAALVTQDHSAYRSDWVSRGSLGNAGRINAFHLARPEMLGPDPTAFGWQRFASATASVDPLRDGRMYVVEYGDVGDDQQAGPRYTVGAWVPASMAQREERKLDMVVWLHPNTTNADTTPQVDHRLGRPYPYGLLINEIGGHAVPTQKFIDIPAFHLYSQHFLAYQLLAARKHAMIVIPIVPSSHFEPFESPGTLMRFLRELTRWLPREIPRGREAQVYSGPPEVGRVVVAGFSASVPRLTTLMTRRVPELHYADAIWGTNADAVDFGDAWKEQWSVDCVADGFSTHLNLAASWVRGGSDRRIRIYKSDFTGGRWLPSGGREGAWASLVRRTAPVTRGSGAVWAQTLSDTRGTWQAVSFSNAFVLGPLVGPAAALQPTLGISGTHELMPRICFGHAALTSRLADTP